MLFKKFIIEQVVYNKALKAYCSFWAKRLEKQKMNQEDFLQIESSQRQHHEVMLHQSKMSAAVGAEEMSLFSILKPSIKQDGDQWCVLYGENLMEGIVGFGKTPYRAILDWNRAFNEEAKSSPKKEE